MFMQLRERGAGESVSDASPCTLMYSQGSEKGYILSGQLSEDEEPKEAFHRLLFLMKSFC